MRGGTDVCALGWMCLYVYVYVCVCMHLHVYLCVYVYACVYACVYLYIYTYVCVVYFFNLVTFSSCYARM